MFMIRFTLSLFFSICVLGGGLLSGGCAHRVKPTITKMPHSDPPSQNTLVLEAKAEASVLRSNLASERIKSAKQAANLRLLQDQAFSLRDREAEHVATISRLKSELETLRTERDRLKNENSDLRAKTAGLPELLKMVTQIRTLETSLSGMTSSLQSLSGEISHMKQDIKNKDAAPSISVKKNPTRGRPSALRIDPSNTEIISVERGDSLWRLGRQYGVSIKELKALNDLKSDLIVVGQTLKVPILMPESHEDVVEIPSPSKTPNP